MILKLLMPRKKILKEMKEKIADRFTVKNTMKEKGNK